MASFTLLAHSASAQVPYTNQITSLPFQGSERLLHISVSDAISGEEGDQLNITNGTSADAQMIPYLYGRHISDNREALVIGGTIAPNNDAPHDADDVFRPLVAIDGRMVDKDGNASPVRRRSLFEVRNLGYLNPMFQVTAWGDVYARGSFFANQLWSISDQRLKSNIVPVDDALGMVRRLQADYYTFNREKFKDMLLPEGRTTGYMAQELAKVIPEAVKLDKDGYYKVNYNAVIPVLSEAIKQLDAKVGDTEKLTQALAEQQAKTAALEKQLNELRALVTQNSQGKAATGTGEASQIGLEQNAPNPFSQTTRIAYALPANVTGATLTIVDALGRVVKTIPNLAGGQQVVELQGGTLAAGTYTYTLAVGGKAVLSKHMVLTR